MSKLSAECTTFTDQITVEWGDCDEAGIVFYPNYLYWFDCTWQRLLRSRGLGQRELRRRFGAVTPLVEVGVTFRSPARYDDVLEVTADIVAWHDKRFRIDYRMSVKGRKVLEGFEVRAWAQSMTDGTLKGAEVDAVFREALS